MFIEEELQQSIEHLRVMKAVDGEQDARLALAMSRMMRAIKEIKEAREEISLLVLENIEYAQDAEEEIAYLKSYVDL